MDSVFMARTDCKLLSPPPSQTHYCPTDTRTLTKDERKICLSPARLQKTKEWTDGNETTPTTLWDLQPVVIRGREGREEEGEGSESSSQYNELWQSSSTVETSRLTEEGEGGGREREGEGGGGKGGKREGGEWGEEGGEGKGEGEDEAEREETSDVDGATGQSTIARYIERFRTAPPTPRDGRRHRLGDTGNFWWQDPLRNPPSDPSLNPPPISHSSPTSTTSSTAEQSSPHNAGNTLEERSQQALRKSSSLLAIGSRSHSTRVHRKQPTSPPPSLPLPSVPGSRGGMEGDILCQWRLRRRLEQARNHTAGLTARLDDCSLPMFKSQSLRTEYGGHHPPVSKEVGRDGHRVQPHQLPLAAESYLPAPHTTTDHAPNSCQQCGQTGGRIAPPSHPLHTSSAPPLSLSHVSHPLCQPGQSHWCVPPHRHALCDIVTCSHCHHTDPPATQQGRGKSRGENTHERTRSSECTPRKEDHTPHELTSTQPLLQSSRSPPQPPIRYPSPSLLDHMRRSSQSHDHCTNPHGHKEERGDMSPSLSETFLSGSTPSPTNHPSPSPQCSIGEAVSRVVKQHLFQDGILADGSIVSAAEDYDDMGDHLLKALVTRARALEHQMRKIHTLLSAVEESCNGCLDTQ